MYKTNLPILLISIITILTYVTGCSSLNNAIKQVERQNAEIKARGTIEAGGYTWEIRADSEGGNTIQTRGSPSKQNAIDAATKLCKKYGRIAQYISQERPSITTTIYFNFNCVR